MRGIRLAGDAASRQADALGALLAGGTLEIHGGTQPKEPEKEHTARVLAIFELLDPAFARAAGGIMQLRKPKPTAVRHNGRATWFRFRTKGGDAVFDGDIGVRDASLILPALDLPVGAELEIASYAYAVPLD